MTTSTHLNEILARYTGAARLFPTGGAPAALTAAETSALRAAGLPANVPTARWTRPDFARFALLRDLAASRTPSEFSEIAIACFQQGDSSEQASWCRAVSLLPAPEQYLQTVI